MDDTKGARKFGNIPVGKKFKEFDELLRKYICKKLFLRL